MRALATILVLLVAGCLEGDPPPAGALDVRESVRAHVQAALDRDVDAMMSFYAADWVDLGGGDGTPDTPEERRERIGAFLASEEWRRKTEGKTVEDVLRWEDADFRAPGAYGDEWEQGSWKERWQPGPADILVYVPPTDGSPLFDGWFGFYREHEARWIQVAGD